MTEDRRQDGGATAFRISNSRGVTLRNVGISNFHTGIRSEGATIVAENVTFDNVVQPWDIQGGTASVAGTRIRNDPKNKKNANKSRVGWEPAAGAALPSLCPACHGIFPSRNYKIHSPSFYGFDNEETCPFCGSEHAKVANGLFDLAKESIKIIQAEPLSHAMLAALAAAAEKFLDGSASVEQTHTALCAIRPTLGAIWNAAWQGSIGLAAILAVYFQVAAKDLEKLQEYLGESPTRDSYQIEQVCLDAFGKAANCRVQVQPIDNSRVGGGHPAEEHGVISHPPKHEKKSERQEDYPALPEIGPIPRPKPST